jgi:hypothetical protein
VQTPPRVGAGVERMWGWGPCGRPLRMRRTHGRPPSRHGGQPQGPQPHSTPPLPLRDAPRHGKNLPLRALWGSGPQKCETHPCPSILVRNLTLPARNGRGFLVRRADLPLYPHRYSRRGPLSPSVSFSEEKPVPWCPQVRYSHLPVLPEFVVEKQSDRKV